MPNTTYGSGTTKALFGVTATILLAWAAWLSLTVINLETDVAALTVKVDDLRTQVSALSAKIYRGADGVGGALANHQKEIVVDVPDPRHP